MDDQARKDALSDAASLRTVCNADGLAADTSDVARAMMTANACAWTMAHYGRPLLVEGAYDAAREAARSAFRAVPGLRG